MDYESYAMNSSLSYRTAYIGFRCVGNVRMVIISFINDIIISNIIHFLYDSHNLFPHILLIGENQI